jgi:hypothetical protein
MSFVILDQFQPMNYFNYHPFGLNPTPMDSVAYPLDTIDRTTSFYTSLNGWKYYAPHFNPLPDQGKAEALQAGKPCWLQHVPDQLCGSLRPS